MTTHTTAETTQTFRCAGCEQKDRRIAELEEAVRQERTAFNELHGTSEARIADLQAKLEVAERENVRLAQEHTQCHEQNSRLVSEHYALRADLASAREMLRRVVEALREHYSPEYGHTLGCFALVGPLGCSTACEQTRALLADPALAAALEEQP